VSDSFNLWEACRELWGTKLKDKIMIAGGTVVVRPDSGDPLTVPIEVIKILMDKFGYTVNSKGFKVLHPSVRVIQGDGINETSLPIILDNLIAAGISVENIAFGMGGGLLQAWNRDSLKYAMKASAIKGVDGAWRGFSKDPITDHGKRSKEGRLALVKEAGFGIPPYIRTVPEEYISEFMATNLLRPVFHNGVILIEDTFENIRERAKEGV
jgi:nicotinamide phosphoribosyltransferase